MTSTFALLLLLPLLTGCPQVGNGDMYADQGSRLFDQRRFDEAIPEFEEALKHPLNYYTRSEVLTAIGNCYNELDELETSLTYHDRAIAEDPANHQAYVNKGICYRLLGEFDKAEEMYLKALELEPNYAELYASMGALAIHQGEHDKAIEHLKRSIELDDSLAVAHSNLAFAYATVGRFDEAEAQLKAAVARGYHQPELVQELIDEMRAEANP